MKVVVDALDGRLAEAVVAVLQGVLDQQFSIERLDDAALPGMAQAEDVLVVSADKAGVVGRSIFADGPGMVIVIDREERASRAGLALVVANEARSDLGAAVLAAAQGRTWLSAQAWGLLMSRGEEASELRANLTAVELETLRMVAIGYTDAQIAVARTVSIATVRHHLRSMRSKTRCSSRHQLAALAYRTGVASPWQV